jgi:glycosyltransferase involved in cell wall biosynthesis
MSKSVFIIIPSLHPAGPIKGALALGNGISQRLPVTLVVLKPGPGVSDAIEAAVPVASLADTPGWMTKIKRLRQQMENAGGRSRVVSVSLCFSADFVNSFMSRHAVTLCSIRGNLPINYRYDYGAKGMLLAKIHYALLRRFDAVVAMSDDMATRLRRLNTSSPVHVIRNFLDEASLESPDGAGGPPEEPFRFIFLGSLSRRKRPELVLRALHALKSHGRPCRLDFVGEGPLRRALEEEIRNRDLGDSVRLLGHLDRPSDMLRKSHYLVLPSESEGISRAAMEALYLGVPCILRDIDANGEIITHGTNGFLFRSDADLPAVMARAIETARRGASAGRRCLLPDAYRQTANVDKFIGLIQSVR